MKSTARPSSFPFYFFNTRRTVRFRLSSLPHLSHRPPTPQAMIKYLLLFLLLIILPDIYIWWNFTRPQSTYWQTALLLAPTVIMLASIAYCLLVPGTSWSFNVFFTLLCVIAVPKLAFLILSLIGQGIAWPFPQSRQALTIIAVVLSVGICGVQLYGTFFGWQRLSTHRRTLHVDRLPKTFDGYRVVQISDLHVGTYGTDDRFLCRLADSVNACHADLVVFTGDIVNTSAKELTPHLEALSRIKAKDGVVSILGNHDYCIYGAQITDAERLTEIKEIVNAERSLGWHVLLNEHTTINRGTDTLFIAGVENTGKPPFPSKGNLTKALQNIPPEACTMLLSHDPWHWRHGILDSTNVTLTLSGHTHAMQFKLGNFSPAKWVNPEWGGLYTEGNRQLFVSTGIGGTVSYRLGAWPSIECFTLKVRQK